MAPQKTTLEAKQKSLMSWFAKGPNATSSTKKDEVKSTKSAVAPSDNASLSQPSSQDPHTPSSKASNIRALNSSVMASSTSSRSHSTPPTSDPIDVDMLASDDEDAHPVQKSGQRKRKVALVDSDEEDSSTRKQKSVAPSSSPVTKVAVKKQRIRKARADDEEEDEDEEPEAVSSFSQKLTIFKKSPVKRERKSRSNASDDDDFTVSDSDDDAKSAKSFASRSSASSRRSVVSSDDEFSDDDEDNQKSKSRPKAQPSAKKTLAKKTSAPADTASSGSGLFLTAAERREQGKKDERKAAESPYSFLEDIKDKEGRRPGEPNYDPRTLYVPKSAWVEFTPFEKQFWEIKQNHYDTILFFQKGKFLELYEDDARIGHQEFDLKLTSRVKMSMVGVPEMSFNFWAAKFLGKGTRPAGMGVLWMNCTFRRFGRL